MLLVCGGAEFDVKINLMVLPEPEDQGDKDYVKKL